MSSFTIFGKNPDRRAILEAMRESTQLRVDVSGSEDSWESVSVTGIGSKLTFNAMIRTKPGDQFSKTVLGAANYFEKINTAAKKNQSSIKAAIFESKILIGIVADPELIETDGHFDLVFDVAQKCDGMIFNGTGMVDPSGHLILDKDGQYDRLLE